MPPAPNVAAFKLWLAISLAVLVYLTIVHSLRYRRSRSLEKRFGANPGQLSATDAQSILKTLAELEFPKIYSFSIFVAIFRTYGIPSISSLLVHTGQLKDPDTASKRAADTGVLLLEIGLNAPTSERAIEAIARMNYLHAPWQRAGKITNDDMLYTLSLFALEPIRWINEYEWRRFTTLELCAQGTFWKGLGDSMQISYEKLHCGKEGWRNGHEWLEELKIWSQQYERMHMVPSSSNQQLGDAFLNGLLRDLSPSLRNFLKSVGYVLLGPRLRKAMDFREPSQTLTKLVLGTLRVRKLFLRYICLPRPAIWRVQHIDDRVDSRDGRYHMHNYVAQPWYVKPSFWTRFGPSAWLSRFFGFKVPGDDGKKYFPNGYAFVEVGPVAFKGKGLKEIGQIRAELLRQRRGRCPF